jgi:hypothetical protein
LGEAAPALIIHPVAARTDVLTSTLHWQGVQIRRMRVLRLFFRDVGGSLNAAWKVSLIVTALFPCHPFFLTEVVMGIIAAKKPLTGRNMLP